MGFLDRLLGEKPPPRRTGTGVPGTGSSDEKALARYRYLLRTAPPDAIEEAHAEAFAQLTPEQRAMALRELSGQLPPSERAGATNDDPRTLARLATRAEMRQPGTLERAFGARGAGMGGMFAGTLMSSIAGTFIGTAIAHQLLGGFDGGHGDEGGDMESAHADASMDESDADMGGDFGDV